MITTVVRRGKARLVVVGIALAGVLCYVAAPSRIAADSSLPNYSIRGAGPFPWEQRKQGAGPFSWPTVNMPVPNIPDIRVWFQSSPPPPPPPDARARLMDWTMAFVSMDALCKLCTRHTHQSALRYRHSFRSTRTLKYRSTCRSATPRKSRRSTRRWP